MLLVADALHGQRRVVEVVGVDQLERGQTLHGLEGLKHLATAMVPAIYDPGALDATVFVATERADDRVRRLAREQGLYKPRYLRQGRTAPARGDNYPRTVNLCQFLFGSFNVPGRAGLARKLPEVCI